MNKIRGTIAIFMLASLGIGGCANHPVDCATGLIAWNDCLPGTVGYKRAGSNNIYNAQTREDEIKKQFDEIEKQYASDISVPSLDPIKGKIELVKGLDDPPSFQYASIDEFPSSKEKEAIAEWAKIRDLAIERERKITPPPGASVADVSFLNKEISFRLEAEEKISELVLALYQQKLTYGEFARQRYVIGKAGAEAMRQYRDSGMLRRRKRQMRAQQLASNQFASALSAWAAYMSSVNERRPMTVHHCTPTGTGSGTSTSCY